MPKNNDAVRHAVRHAVCDTAGFYDRFTIADLLEWVPHGQATRDAVRSLVREGLLRHAARGVYEWVKK